MENKTKRTIVVSGINLRSGGPLTILRDCLAYLSEGELSKEYRIVALVHSRALADYPNIEYIEFPKSITSWVYRLYYEYFYFQRLSKELKPYLWLSLHDVTPNVICPNQAVYMHNPSIVNKIKRSDWKFDKKYIAFALLYKFLYRINIRRNRFCIVQQNWFRDICADKFGIPKQQIIVARPFAQHLESVARATGEKGCRKFFFPSLPRPFKNFETVCAAATILERKGLTDIKVTITLDGSENAYSKWIYSKYGDCGIIKFAGLLTTEEMKATYAETDCLIFPSRLETWGLPISEFIPYMKPMIIADEPYAHETSEGAESVAYFPTNDAKTLAQIMEQAVTGDFSKFSKNAVAQLCPPYARNYRELFNTLLQ